MKYRGYQFLSTRWFPLVVLLTIAINFSILLIPSCKSSPERAKNSDKPAQREDLIRNHQNKIRDEALQIDEYVKRHQLPVEVSQTGLRYHIYKNGDGNQTAVNDQWVTLNYRVSRLDGSQVYSSDSTGSLEFQVGKSDIASGLQEGVKLMKTGDKAIFIIPSHLAYGLTGDGDLISHYESLVIDAELVKITDSK